MSDDVIRLDLSDQDDAFIQEALIGFIESSAEYGRTLSEVRLTQPMYQRLSSVIVCEELKGIRFVISEFPDDDTVEVCLTLQN